MTESIAPLIMLALFLAGTLWLGMRYKKGSHNIIEYTIGNRMFTTATLVATVVATNYEGGGLIRTVEMIFAQGLWYSIFSIGWIVINCLMCATIASRIGIFIENHIPSKNHISMGDTIGHIYGRISGIIASLANVGAAIPIVAIQITVTSRIMHLCISDVDPNVLMIISASIVILYSVFGGVQSVTITDILQCATFTLMIPYVAYKVFHHTGMSVPQIFKAVSQSDKFQFEPIFRNKTQLMSLLAGWLASISPDAASVQRMYMAKNGQQAKETYFISAILMLVIKIIIVFIGIVVCVGYSNLTNPVMIWPAVVSGSSAIFIGFFAISLFAMAMSTTDSMLNVTSSMVAHDIINPLRKNKLSAKQQLYLAKIACFVIGIFSVALVLSISKYKDALLRLLFLSMDIGNPIFVAPFLLAVWGFRCNAKTAVLGITAGAITITLWNKFIPGINGSFVAMLANGITMLLAHYSLPDKDRQSWQKPSLDYRQLQQSRQRKFYRFKKYISGLFSKLQYTPSNSHYIVLLAFYILTTSWIPLFSGNMFGISRGSNDYHLLYWPLFQCLVALSMIVTVVRISERRGRSSI